MDATHPDPTVKSREDQADLQYKRNWPYENTSRNTKNKDRNYLLL